MAKTKADLERELDLSRVLNEELQKENDFLISENNELRRFVNYVRGLKTEQDFLNLRKILQEADKKFDSESNGE